MKMTKISAMTAAAAMVAMVAACGGGGGGDAAPASNSASAAAPAGAVDATLPAAVDAAFNRKDASRLMLIQGATVFAANVSAFVQNANGLVTNLNGITLTGNVGGSELAGNADYALGRWSAGNVNFPFVLNSASSVILDFNPDFSAHYLVYNPPLALPQATGLSCGEGKFTAATRRRLASDPGPYSQILGTTTASGSYDHAAEGGKFTLDIRTVAGGESGRVVLSGSFDTPGRTLAVDDADPNNGNAYVGLAEVSGSPGAVRLVVQHKVTMPSGKRYQGVLMLVCK